MPGTKNFRELRDEARLDPERARRIDEAKLRAVSEITTYPLSDLRHALGVTQAELAAMIGKSQSAISQIESGEIGLSLGLLKSIVGELGGELQIAAVFKDGRILIDA